MEGVNRVIRRRRISFSIATFGLFLLITCCAVALADEASAATTAETERRDGGYYTIVDERNQKIHCTAIILSKGDEFITADNLRYRITEVKGNIARAQLIGREKDEKAAAGFWGFLWLQLMTAQKSNGVGIYHTHSDESYVPTDGTDSIYANGGILKVGEAFAKKLRHLGFEVYHSKRPHDPHDINSYYRSRRTAVELLQKRPQALFDVHRDATPPEVYAASVKGQEVTQVKFVLGRTNPNLSANLDFAKRIKRVLDRTHPGLVKGILLVASDFNQDLAPNSLLIEVGSHTNSRDAAERGVAFFAEALPEVLGVEPRQPGAPAPPVPENKGSWKALFWALFLVAGAVGGYLYINTGSLEKSWYQIRDFISRLKVGESLSRVRDVFFRIKSKQ
jgi:stage II sporulation protein P